MLTSDNREQVIVQPLIPMDNDGIYYFLAGEFVTPILLIIILALFIHLVLSLVRQRQRNALRSDSLVTVV